MSEVVFDNIADIEDVNDEWYVSDAIAVGTVFKTANGIFCQLMDEMSIWEFFDEDLNELDIGGLQDEMFPIEVIKEMERRESYIYWQELNVFRERTMIELSAKKDGSAPALIEGAL